MMDDKLLKHLGVSYVLDVESARHRSLENWTHDTIEKGRVDMDYDATYEAFHESIMQANQLITDAKKNQSIVMVVCTHGSNESAVVCIAHLLRRPASAPRKAYIDKLKALEREVSGKVTLRSESVGPSMIDIMNADSTVERASMLSNFSVSTMMPTGASLRETVMIAESEEDGVSTIREEQTAIPPTTTTSIVRKPKTKASCTIQ
ncbi:TPA: hypothetical protein N0F65_005867 [Lagenidium giganteum]|uniref:Dual specificity phosphatase catalytic domain-containing protein n=1 Tax=Lagenidium giganteum TaxID=4803 RepID=A0AAV2YN32_9STRA|nr:TPA: hypothetical protein N0F65_005867 [Lagenidium giganteum]